jgi:hypothetical protein
MKAETPTQEVIDYLKKRHPLYFIAQKVSEEQITDLVNRLKYKLKQMQGMMGGTTTAKDTKESKKENQQSSTAATNANTRPQTATTRPQTATTASSSLLGPLPSLTQQ